MQRYTQKELKNLVERGLAVDVTNADNDTRDEIIKNEGFYSQIRYAAGVYGCNGMLLIGNHTRTLYAVCARTNAIYVF